MNRQSECIVCGRWFFNHNGMMIVLPDTYDDSKCKSCNRKIKEEVEEEEGDYVKRNNE